MMKPCRSVLDFALGLLAFGILVTMGLGPWFLGASIILANLGVTL